MREPTSTPNCNPAVDSSVSHALNIARWINDSIKPDMLITIPVPHCAPRSADWYLRRWVRAVEVELYGKRSLKAASNRRPLWLFVKETMCEPSKPQRRPNGAVGKFLHVHLLVALPKQPMKIEREVGSPLSVEARCRVMEKALLNATQTTPEPFNGAADVRTQPYKPADAAYILKQVRPAHRDHWTEQVDAALLRDAGIAMLPAPRKSNFARREHRQFVTVVDADGFVVLADDVRTTRTRTIDGVEYEVLWDGSHSRQGYPSSHDDELLPSRPYGVRSLERFSLTRSDLARVCASGRSK